MNVFIDGQIRLTIGNGEEEKVIVSYGSHTLYAEINSITKSQSLTVQANSNQINFQANPKMKMWSSTNTIAVQVQLAVFD